MRALRLLTQRAAVIANAGLTAEQTVGELTVLIGRATSSSTLPMILTVDPAREVPHEFRVWRGAQSIVDGLRVFMRAGIWPGPADIPSVDRLMTERFDRNAFATTIWGEGATEEGPWVGIWRERDVRHGLYVVARGARGEITVMLFNRVAAMPAYTADNLAACEALVPVIAAALDAAPTPCNGHWLPSREAPIAFSTDGKLQTLGHGALEFLSYAGGGGPDAVARARLIAERAVATLTLPQTPPRETGEAFNSTYTHIWLNRRTAEDRVLLVADTPFGRFDMRVSLAVDLDGGTRALGVLRHLVPRRLAVVRALVEHDVPAREMEVALGIERGHSLPDAGETLGISAETVKTLYRRLCHRFAASRREDLLEAMAKAGTEVLR